MDIFAVFYSGDGYGCHGRLYILRSMDNRHMDGIQIFMAVEFFIFFGCLDLVYD